MRTAIWFIYFWLYQLFLYPRLLYVKILDKNKRYKERDEIVYKTVSRWARSLVKLTGSRISVTGQENIPKSGPVVFMSNHQGNFDIPIMMGYIDTPKAFISKIEIQKIPLVSTWMKYMNCVFMDRKDIRQSVESINKSVAYIKQGYSFVIFPEGTRSKGDFMGDFKQGSFKLAIKAGVPIVPVTIKGSYKIMEENGFMIKPASVQVIISQPIDTKVLTKEEAKDLPQVVKNIISANLIA